MFICFAVFVIQIEKNENDIVKISHLHVNTIPMKRLK
jgi:hypothetical protein